MLEFSKFLRFANKAIKIRQVTGFGKFKSKEKSFRKVFQVCDEICAFVISHWVFVKTYALQVAMLFYKLCCNMHGKSLWDNCGPLAFST